MGNGCDNMLISELLERLKSEPMKEICTDLRCSVSKIQRRLKKIGYEYDNSSKKWNWEKEGEEPLNINILSDEKENSPSQPKQMKLNSPIVHVDNENISPNNNTKENYSLTKDELLVIREIIKEWKPKISESPGPLYEQVAALPPDKKTRRTIVIGETTSQLFDAFSDRHRLLNKSDLIELALLDFMDKHK